MRGTNLHLTLAFIGELDDATGVVLAQRLNTLESKPFVWTLDQTGAFDGARVLWAGGRDDPRLTLLATQVRALLDAMRVRYDRKPFVPHVTLLRNLPRAAARDAARPVDPPIAWRVERTVLVRSVQDDTGTRYETVGPGTAEP